MRDAIVFIGVAQEKAQAFNGKKVNGRFQFDRDKTVYVNHYYFYIDDEEFGPLFLKICSYAPWSVKLCLNGHEWAKRQLDKRHITYEALDNGFLSCSEPVKLQEICDALGPEDIDRVFRKWLRRIPLPLRPEDRRAGFDWDLSIWQMEVSLTQIFDRPLRGREFFEEIIRDNLDLGRPDRVQLVFDRAVTKKTPGEFRTRVIQDGVHPSLHIHYKNFDLKQYFKQGRGCRTEGTFRNPHDFGINKGLANLPYLQKIGRQINRRLLEVERVSHNSGQRGISRGSRNGMSMSPQEATAAFTYITPLTLEGSHLGRVIIEPWRASARYSRKQVSALSLQEFYALWPKQQIAIEGRISQKVVVLIAESLCQ